MVAVLEKTPEAAAAFCMDKYIDENGGRTTDLRGVSFTPWLIKEQDIYRFRDIYNGIARTGNFLRCETVMFRTSKMDGLRYDLDAGVGTAIDTHLWFQILCKHPICIVNKQLVKYRIHGGQDSKGQLDNTQGNKPVWHIDAMYAGLKMNPIEIHS